MVTTLEANKREELGLALCAMINMDYICTGDEGLGKCVYLHCANARWMTACLSRFSSHLSPLSFRCALFEEFFWVQVFLFCPEMIPLALGILFSQGDSFNADA